MHVFKSLSGSLSLVLALVCTAGAAGPLRAQGTFDFGLGLETLFDHQESLDLASMHSMVTVRDSGGGGSVTEIPSDSALLNRKFDFLSELKGEGAHGSIARPALGLFHPTFHWQALSADLRLDFLDRPEPEESTSIEGRGLLYGAGLDLVTALCRQCGWFVGVGYLVQEMPSFRADRSPRLAGPGLDLSRDEVRIRRQVRDASFRIGYGLPGGRVITYTGVRRRSTDLDIEDELGFRGPGPDGTTGETLLTTRTKIQGDATLAVAGLDVKFGGGLSGRVETAIGDGDRVVLVKLIYIKSKTDDGKIEEDKIEEDKMKERARVIAAGILARLIDIEKEYLDGWRRLTVVPGDDGESSYFVRDVEALLAGTEADLLAALRAYPELEALVDWIRDEFGRARMDLELEATGRIAEQVGENVLPASFGGSGPRYGLASAISQAQGNAPVIAQSQADRRLSKVRDKPVGIPRKAAETGDGFHTRFGFETDFGNETKVFIYPRYRRKSPHAAIVEPGERRTLWIGSYAFEVRKGNRPTPYWCHPNKDGSTVTCPLDLVPKGCKVLRCLLKICRQKDEDNEEECK